jgi:predicted transcriptional regulator
MTPSAIRAYRQQLGLTCGQAGRLTGVDDRAWRRMEDGTVEARGPLTRLLRLLVAVPGALPALRVIAETEETKPNAAVE